MAIKKSKTLAETAKEVLTKQKIEEQKREKLEEGSTLPTVGPVTGGVSNPNPVDPSTASTSNAKTLRPGSKASEGRHGQNGGGSGPDKFDDFEDLGGATPTSLYKDNLGAKASGAEKRDKSIKGSGNNQEPPKHLEEDDDVNDDNVVEEEFELPEELKDFIEEAIEAGLSEKEIEQAIAENFEFIPEEDETELDEEVEGFLASLEGLSEEEIDEEVDQLDELSREKLYKYIDKSKEDFNKNYSKNPAKSAKRMAGIHKARKHIQKDLDKNHGGYRSTYGYTHEGMENYEIDLSEDVNALLEGENLSEEFRTKATTIFEAAVKSKLAEEISVMEAAYAQSLEENVEQIMEELSEEVDKYLNYVVEQWVEENEIAIESSLRSELTEDFISGLRTLFAEHYIDIPEEEVNVVEELNSTVEELQEKLNSEMERNVALTAALNESNRNDIISTVCEGLTAIQADKLRSLAETVEFSDDEEYAEKVLTIRENYFPTAVKSDKVLDRVESQDPKMISESTLEGPMARYVKALGGKLPN